MGPLLAETAAAQAKGTIGPEHVEIIRSFTAKLPGWVDPVTREQTEATLVRIATADRSRDAAQGRRHTGHR